MNPIKVNRHTIIDGRIISRNHIVFSSELSNITKYIYNSIFDTEIIYRRFIYNDENRDYKEIEDLQCLLCAYESNGVLNSYRNLLNKYREGCGSNCKCPYEFRAPTMPQYSSVRPPPGLVCLVCRKVYTIKELIQQEKLKKKLTGLYLESEFSSENILNALPNDISKYVVKYI
jgi:hypothetical protein